MGKANWWSPKWLDRILPAKTHRDSLEDKVEAEESE
jgi:hypothetical protein